MFYLVALQLGSLNSLVRHNLFDVTLNSVRCNFELVTLEIEECSYSILITGFRHTLSTSLAMPFFHTPLHEAMSQLGWLDNWHFWPDAEPIFDYSEALCLWI